MRGAETISLALLLMTIASEMRFKISAQDAVRGLA